MLKLGKRHFYTLLLTPLLGFGLHSVCAAHDSEVDRSKMGLTANETARELKDVTIEEKLGQNLDFNLQFTDDNGEKVSLGSFFDGKTPVALSLVYFGCPGLCSFHLNGVVDSLKTLDWSIGTQFKYLVVSFDSREGADLAKQKKETYLKLYGRPPSALGWHFLTADQETITRLTQQVGFKYQWKEDSKEWAHASAMMIATPEGKISRYLHGIIFDPKNIRLALIEATEGKIGNIVDKMIWYCFHYDPKQSKYTIMASNVMKLGGVAIILVMGAVLFPFWMRTRKEDLKSS